VATEWGFLTNHGRALLCIAHDPGVRLREIAETLGITERSAYSIVSDLTTAGYVLKKRDGRRNWYVIQQHRRVREPTLRERTVGDVLELLVGEKRRPRAAAGKKTAPTARKSQKRR
jgi:DNA-binding IscR family transcriptional regulator